MRQNRRLSIFDQEEVYTVTSPQKSLQPGAEWLEQAGIQQIIDMFDLVSDMLFWIKDAESRIIYCNKFYLDQIGASSLSQAAGSDDYAFSPPYIARQFIVDDKQVMSGSEVHERLEMNTLRSGEVAWFTTSKRPLFNLEGSVIGSYGISRHLGKITQVTSGFNALKIPTDYIRAHFADDISMEALASISNLSVSALERRFKKHMAKTPKQFINEVRLENARRMLVETPLSIATIACESGFPDHSYFSRKFGELFGERPSVFRKNHEQCI